MFGCCKAMHFWIVNLRCKSTCGNRIWMNCCKSSYCCTYRMSSLHAVLSKRFIFIFIWMWAMKWKVENVHIFNVKRRHTRQQRQLNAVEMHFDFDDSQLQQSVNFESWSPHNEICNAVQRMAVQKRYGFDSRFRFIIARKEFEAIFSEKSTFLSTATIHWLAMCHFVLLNLMANRLIHCYFFSSSSLLGFLSRISGTLKEAVVK